jgi:amino acid transporter
MARTVSAEPSTRPGPGLRHVMTRYDLTMASFGGVIGSGWLFGAMYSAQYAGPAATIAWIVGGLMVLILALPFAEMVSAIPEAGGINRYPQMTHGSLVSATMSWGNWLGYAMTAPIEAEAVTQYAAGYIHGLYANGSLTPAGLSMAGALVLVFFLINYYGVQLFARVNSVVTTIKFLVPTATMAVLLVAGLTSGGARNLANPATGGFMPYGWHGVLVAISVGGILFAYSGFRQALDLAAEGRNPQRDVPRAIVTVLLGALVLYTLLQVAFIVAVSHADLAHGWANLNFSSPFAQLAAGLNLGFLATILYGDAIVSPAGTGLVYTATTARVLYAIPKNGYGPEALMRLNQRGVPRNGMLVALVVGLLALLPFPAWGAMVGILSSVSAFTYAMGATSFGALRRIAPELPRRFSLGVHGRWIAPLAFGFGALLLYWSGWPLVGELMGVLVVGLLIYLYYRQRNRLPARDITAGIWFLAFMAFELVMSYIGSFGGQKLIPFPLDSVILFVGSVVFYFWGVASGYRTQTLEEFAEGRNVDFQQDLEPGA